MSATPARWPLWVGGGLTLSALALNAYAVNQPKGQARGAYGIALLANLTGLGLLTWGIVRAPPIFIPPHEPPNQT